MEALDNITQIRSIDGTRDEVVFAVQDENRYRDVLPLGCRVQLGPLLHEGTRRRIPDPFAACRLIIEKRLDRLVFDKQLVVAGVNSQVGLKNVIWDLPQCALGPADVLKVVEERTGDGIDHNDPFHRRLLCHERHLYPTDAKTDQKDVLGVYEVVIAQCPQPLDVALNLRLQVRTFALARWTLAITDTRLFDPHRYEPPTRESIKQL